MCLMPAGLAFAIGPIALRLWGCCRQRVATVSLARWTRTELLIIW
jgi:hypothetical protein